jgi:choice-of-anchor B domain-containing protein
MQILKKLLPSLLFFLAVMSLDAQQAMNMSLIAHWDPDTLPTTGGGLQYNDIWGYVDCQGNEYAIIGSARFVHFMNITDPANPVEVARFSGTSNSIWRDFKVYRDRAYAVADQGSDGMMIFDLSGLPDTIVKTNQTTAFFSRTHNIYIDEQHGRLYTAGANTRSNGVIVLDLTQDPDNPSLLASTALPGGYIHDIHVVDNIGYCSHGNSGLYVYDLSSPATPVTLGSLTSYPESGYNHSSWLHEDGNFLVFADETHGRSLKLADVSDLTDITVVSLFKSALLAPEVTNSIAHNPFIRDNYAIIAYYHEGVQIFDISNPEEVVNVGWYDTYPSNTNYSGYDGVWGVYPYLPSGLILASDTENGLFILSADNITFNPIAPNLTPEAALTIDGPQSFCEGETTLLVLTEGAQDYEWYKDSVLISQGSSSLTIDQSGVYYGVARNGQCRQASEAVEIQATPSPDAEIGIAEMTLCDSAPYTFLVPEGGESYTWYKDGELFLETTSNQMTISEAGEYQLEVTAGGCTATSGLLTVLEVPFPDVSLPGYEYVLCQGDSLTLNAPPGAGHYAWYHNGMLISEGATEEIVISAGGIYTLEAANGICFDVSDEIIVSVLPAPEFTYSFSGPLGFCEGEFVTIAVNSALELSFSLVDAGGGSIPFETEIAIDETGSFSILAENEACQVQTPYFAVEVFQPAAPDISVDLNLLTSTEAAAYQWYFFDDPIPGATDRIWTATESGLYFVEIIDMNGCIARSNAVEVFVTSVAESNSGLLHVFPNPVSGMLTIRLDDPDGRLEHLALFDAAGRLLWTTDPLENSHQLDMSALPAGVYRLRVSVGGNVRIMMVVKI